MEQQAMAELSVVDVYDIASEIGKEFEKIIDDHGSDIVLNLMPKVIYALEHLENFTLQSEKENSTIQDLKVRIAKLESEKVEKAENQKKFEVELEHIEELWRSETRDLVEVLAKVQEENRRLKGTVDERKSSSSSETNAAPEVDIVVFQKLKAMIDNQREQIRSKEKELTLKLSELESLTTQVDRLTTTAKELRRRHKMVQSQVRNLIEERADFVSQLQDQQREICVLKRNLGIAAKENEDLTKNSFDSNSLEVGNKSVCDSDEPNKPRFTTAELKEILQERNDLKAKISDLEDELELYRPKNAPILDEDAPVQGPLPLEPDDAPWKKSTGSYVRKFFRKLLTENNITFLGGSPKRSFSTISKLGLSNSATNTTGI